jgi:pyruvate kinase
MTAPNANSNLTRPEILLGKMLQLRKEVEAEAEALFARWQPTIRRANFQHSARNLAYYLALRHHDLRHLQAALRPWGLSSLGRIEAQVLQNLDAVIATLVKLSQEDPEKYPQHPRVEAFTQGARLLDAECVTVFGPTPPHRRVRMMVTLPSEAASDGKLVRNLLEHGMNVARINCAHDTPDEWAKMIGNLRAAETKTGISCKIAMDLGGPKARTADLIQPENHRFTRGQLLLLTSSTPQPAEQYPLQVRCTLPEALIPVKIGAPVWFDDGKIGAVVRERLPQGLLLEITHAKEKGSRLKPDKGINFPGTHLDLSPLTQQDLQDLDFIVRHADLINYSFVQKADDIRLIQQEIAARKPDHTLALVAKIETAKAIENLPEMIVAASGQQPFGVMIARGDLAVEIGFERMAEMQEEILWVCEAAHVPVIWATQVLETVAKQGRPSRAEMTDAAMSERAECVMLNKGPYILEAMTLLDSVLTRMQSHQSKKTAQLRALRSW